MLSLTNIEFAYEGRKRLFQANELKLEKGKMIALLGANGSGKSSLIRCLCGLEKGFQGSIQIEGQEIRTYSPKRLSKLLSTVLTDSPYPPQMTVEEFVSFGRYPYTNWLAQQREEDQAKIRESMISCSIDHLREKSLGEISDGERQRCMIARALSQEADYIILDEPTTHLDSINTIKILRLLKELSQKEGKAVIYSSHKIMESLQLVDQLWLIHEEEIKKYTKEEFGLDTQLQKAVFGEHFHYDLQTQSFRFL